MTSPKLYQTGEEFSLRRPQTTQGGTELAPGQRLRIVAEEPAGHDWGDTWNYTLVTLDEHGQPGDASDPKQTLVLSQGRVTRHCRRAGVWQAISKGSMPSVLPQSM